MNAPSPPANRAAQRKRPPRTFRPAEHYAALSREGDVFAQGPGVWVVTGYELLMKCLRDPRLSSEWPRGHSGLGSGERVDRTDETVRSWFLFRDEPDHRRLRGLVLEHFSAKAIDELRPFIAQTAASIVDALPAGEVDIVEELAFPLSRTAVLRVVGLPEDCLPDLGRWSRDLAAFLISDYLPEVAERGRAAIGAVTAVVDELRRSRSAPEGSVIATLLRHYDAGALSEQELFATASLMLFAGFETTSTFIGKAVAAVVESNQFRLVRAADVASLVDELLRYDTSVAQVARVATDDLTLGSATVRPGELVILMLGAGNHDENVFEQPTSLCPGRTTRHLGFGFGSHYCIGARLARAQAEAALTALFRRIDPDGGIQVRYQHHHLGAGLEGVLVQLLP
jgi:cytochrome P450